MADASAGVMMSLLIRAMMFLSGIKTRHMGRVSETND
jgi:hypothetical protein